MAKQKLNIKFLAIILGVAAVFLVSATVIALVIYRNDPIKHITTGDGYMANGQYDRASKSYFRAFGKDPYQTAEYRPIDKSIAAVQSIVPKTDIEARDRQNQILVLFANKAIYAPESVERDTTIREQIIPVMQGIGRRDQLVTTLVNLEGLSDDTKARLEGVLLEGDWANASKLSPNEWEATRDDLEQAIQLDPTNIRNQYGVLRGDLEQAFGQSTSSLKIAAATKPFNESLAAAREAAGPAWEFDAIELERNLRIARMGLRDRDIEGRGVEAPDPQKIAALVQAIRDAAAASPAESERERFELLQRIFIVNHQKTWLNSRDPELAVACDRELRDGIIALSNAIYATDPDDFRGKANRLDTLAIVSQQEAELDRLALEKLVEDGQFVEGSPSPAEIRLAKKRADRLALSQEIIAIERGPMGGPKKSDGSFASKVSLNEVYFRNMQRIARKVVLGEAIEMHRNSRESLAAEERDLSFEEVEAALVAYRLEFEDQNRSEVNKAILIVESLRGEDLSARGRMAEATGAFAKAVTAYNQLVSLGIENETSFSPNELEAAMVANRKTDQFGVATGIKKRYADRNPALWLDAGFLQSYAQDLMSAGRLEESRRFAVRAQEIATERGDAERLGSLEKILAAIESQVESGSGSSLAGMEFLAEDSVALASGDLAERQRILRSIVDRPLADPAVDRGVRVQALRRLIGISEQTNDQEGLRNFAEKLREVNPGDTIATMILESESSSYLDRARALARINVEREIGLDYSPQDFDVVVASYLGEYLRASRLTPLGKENVSDDFMAERDAIRTEAERLNESILAIPDDQKLPSTLRHVIRRAIGNEQRDTEQARAWIEILRSREGESEFTVQSQIVLYRMTGEQDKALELAERACNEMGLGTTEIRFAYGLLLGMRNDRVGALRQWNLANEQSPRDLRVAAALSDLLASMGETSQSLEILRRANLAVGASDAAFRERWLAAEQTAGNSLTIINERGRVFAANPGDISNAIALAQALMQSRIDRLDITEEVKDLKTGEMVAKPSYTEREWARLNASEKNSRITMKARERSEEAGVVLKKLRAFDDTDPSVIIAISRFQRQAGDQPEASRELQEAIDRLSVMTDEPKNRRALLLLEQGRNLWTQGSRAEAREKFRSSIEFQAEGSVEATALVAEFLTARNEIGEAIPYQEALLARLESAGSARSIIRLVARDLVTAYLAEDQIEKAESRIEEYVDRASANYGEQIVLGRLAFAKATQMWKSFGDRQGAVKQIEETISLADSAASMPDAQAEAPLLRADALQLQLTTMTDPDAMKEVLEEATLSYRRAIAFEQRDWRIRLALVQFLVRNFEYETAVSELEQFIGIRADIPDASIRLASLLDTRLSQGGKAIQVGQAGLNRSPKNLPLINLVATLREKRKEYDKAAALYSKAYEMTEQPGFLAREIRVRMNRIPPDFNSVIKLARSNPRVFAQDPAIAAAYATAVKLSEIQQGRGLNQFEDVYSAFKSRTGENIVKNAADPFMLARARQLQEQTMEVIAFWYPWLFGSQNNESGFDYKEKDAAALADFIEQVSGGSPSLHDLLQLNRAWISAGNDVLAIEALERALELENISEGGRYAAYVRLGTVLLAFENPDCERALDIFNRASALRPQDDLVKNNLAYAIFKCGRDLKKALELSLEAVESRPANASFRDTLARIYLAIGESLDETDSERLEYLRASEQEFKIALKISPTNSDYRIGIANAFLSLGKCGDARTALKTAGDAGPSPTQQDEIDGLAVKLAECERDR